MYPVSPVVTGLAGAGPTLRVTDVPLSLSYTTPTSSAPGHHWSVHFVVSSFQYRSINGSRQCSTFVGLALFIQNSLETLPVGAVSVVGSFTAERRSLVLRTRVSLTSHPLKDI